MGDSTLRARPVDHGILAYLFLFVVCLLPNNFPVVSAYLISACILVRFDGSKNYAYCMVEDLILQNRFSTMGWVDNI